MLDWEGNIQQKKDCQQRILIDNIQDDSNMVTSLEITQLEQETIDAYLDDNDKHCKGTTTTNIAKVETHWDLYITHLWIMTKHTNLMIYIYR